MKVYQYPQKTKWPDLCQRPVFDFSELERRVQPILDTVKADGDQALRAFTQKFDKVSLTNIQVKPEEIAAASSRISSELKAAIRQSIANVTTYHSSQGHEESMVETMPGVTCWRRSVPIERVGFYIPGGTAPLFSTVIMLAAPAQLAGCKEIILCSPPDKEGKIHPAILFTAKEVGITKIFKAGGAQAIAAMAYGTETIPRAYKIFGPGNQYVMMAKQLVAKSGIAIDLPAGPSEVAVLADETSRADFVAADLLSQAEHGIDSQVLLVSTSVQKVEEILIEIHEQIRDLPRRLIAEKALENSIAVVLKNADEAMDLLNEYAAEHLILSIDDYPSITHKIINAGSVFLGHYSPESVGDYASGTNHTLPTNGFAKAFSGVSMDSFCKKITFQKLTEQGLKNIGKTVEVMAAAEELEGHKNAVSVRLKALG